MRCVAHSATLWANRTSSQRFRGAVFSSLPRCTPPARARRRWRTSSPKPPRLWPPPPPTVDPHSRGVASWASPRWPELSLPASCIRSGAASLHCRIRQSRRPRRCGQSLCLPFEDLSPDKNMEYFGDGIAEELMTNLAKVDRVQVVGRRSAFMLKGRALDAHSVGEMLKVQTILEGSVRREGDRVRITAQLSRTSDGFSLWAETFDRKLDDVLDLQGRIAADVVTALRPLVKGSSSSQARSPTTNAEAYAAYQRGVFIFRKQIDAELAHACEELHRATELDAGFALAQARLGMCYEAMAYRTVGANADLQALADASVGKALKLDPALGDLWWMHWLNERENSAFTYRVAELERAVAADPSDAEPMLPLTYDYRLLGRFDDALRMNERAYATEPLWLPAMFWVAFVGFESRGDRQRLFEIADAIERIAPDDPDAENLRMHVALVDGRALDWDKAAARSVAIAPGDIAVNGYLSLDYARLGDPRRRLSSRTHHAARELEERRGLVQHRTHPPDFGQYRCRATGGRGRGQAASRRLSRAPLARGAAVLRGRLRATPSNRCCWLSRSSHSHRLPSTWSTRIESVPVLDMVPAQDRQHGARRPDTGSVRNSVSGSFHTWLLRGIARAHGGGDGKPCRARHESARPRGHKLRVARIFDARAADATVSDRPGGCAADCEARDAPRRVAEDRAENLDVLSCARNRSGASELGLL